MSRWRDWGGRGRRRGRSRGRREKGEREREREEAEREAKIGGGKVLTDCGVHCVWKLDEGMETEGAGNEEAEEQAAAAAASATVMRINSLWDFLSSSFSAALAAALRACLARFFSSLSASLAFFFSSLCLSLSLSKKIRVGAAMAGRSETVRRRGAAESLEAVAIAIVSMPAESSSEVLMSTKSPL